MTPLERLRLAVALAHCVPGSELRLRTTTDKTVFVGAHPAADINACAMRRFVRVATCSRQPDYSERVRSLEFGGALEDLGGSVFRVTDNGQEQRWIASLLIPARMAALLDGVDMNDVPHDAVHARLKPDTELNVTMLVITADDVNHAHHLDEIATRAAAAIFVDEMWCGVMHEFLTSEPSHGSAGDDARRPV